MKEKKDNQPHFYKKKIYFSKIMRLLFFSSQSPSTFDNNTILLIFAKIIYSTKIIKLDRVLLYITLEALYTQ